MSRKEKESAILGENISAANHKLRKLIFFSLLVELGRDNCFKCGEQIADARELSIDHILPWRDLELGHRGKELFWDLHNIAFSHRKCNVTHPKNTCRNGHELTEENTRFKLNGSGRRVRVCRTCIRDRERKSRS